jgi:hypothetical protein
MKNGAKRYTATIARWATEPDAMGSLDETYVADPVTRKCSMVQRTFRERLENNQLIQRIEYQLTFHYEPELELLLPGAQITVNGRVLEVISSGDPDGTKRCVIIYAESLR